MDPSIVGALAALLGSMVGGSATIVTTWITLRTQGRRELVTAETRKRELLYTEFIVECSKLNIDSLDHTLDHVETLTQVHALVNRIRLVSTSAVLAAAEAAVKRILKQYVRPNLTGEEIQELALSDYDDPLKQFGEACRHELQELLHAASS
jgi:hypothetical protein